MTDYPTAYRRGSYSPNRFMETGSRSSGSQARTPIREGYRYGGSGYRRPADRPVRGPRTPGTFPGTRQPRNVPRPKTAPKPVAASAAPAREPLLGQYAGVARRGMLLLARRGNPWLNAADMLAQLYMLRGGKDAVEQHVQFHPPSSYVLKCVGSGSGTCLSGQYSFQPCWDGQYMSCGPVTADSKFISEVTPSSTNPPWPDGAMHRGWERIGTATAAPELIPASPAEAPIVAPMPSFLPSPLSLPQVMPQLDPAAQPPGVMPEITPMPVPFDVVPHLKPNPNRDPVEQTTRGPDPAPVTPGAPPVGPVVPPAAGGQPNVVVRPVRPEDFRPPRKREKERKVMISLPASHPIMRGLGGFTEGLDFTDSFYEALPEEIKRKAWREHGGYIDPADKLLILYENWNTLDLSFFGRALLNLAKNEIEDRLIGKSSEFIRTNQTRGGWLGRPVGTGSGTGGLSGLNF